MTSSRELCPPTGGTWSSGPSVNADEEKDGEVVRPTRFATGTQLDYEAWASPDEVTHPGSRVDRTRVAVVSGKGDVTELTHNSTVGAPNDIDDVLRAPAACSHAERTQLWEVMSREVVCVRQDLDAALVLPLLTALDVKALTVVDRAGRPLGMVSRADALEPRAVRETVEDMMVCMAFMLRETTSLSRAAALMAYEEVHRLPVVSAEWQVVGMISALDVVRWLARNDGYVLPAAAASEPPRFDFLLRIAAALTRCRGGA
jgi:CBS domain-containing protein